ncbi:MAG: hypothetical protein AMXMBFR53_19790 [Gemmatimonadota bacterium]
MNSAVFIPALASVVAIVIGGFLGHLLARSRPWAGIVAISRNEAELVSVPAEFMAVYTGRSVQEVGADRLTLKKLYEIRKDASDNAEGAKRALEACNAAIARFEATGLSQDEKKEAIYSFIGNSSIWSNLNHLMRFGRIPLPDKLDDDIRAAEPLVQVEDATTSPGNQAVVVYGKTGKNLLVPGSGPYGDVALERLRKVGNIIQYFHQPWIGRVARAIAEEIESDLKRYLRLREGVDDLIQERNLVIRVHVTNVGARPEHIGSHGLLLLSSGGRPVKPIVVAVKDARLYEPGLEQLDHTVAVAEAMAVKQGASVPERVSPIGATAQFSVVSPGTVVQLELHTIEPIEDRAVIQALQDGMLGTRVVLERVGRRWGKWLRTDVLVLGESLSAQKRELLIKSAS